jgi:lipopolysaccharide export system protein LptA
MSRRFFRNNTLVASALCLLATASASVALETGAREPMVVTSARMEADELGNTVTFVGDVTLKKEAMTLTSDHVVVFYDPATKGVREIEALGNVVVRKEGRVAQANKAIYYSKDEKIVLTGDARINENDNQLGGERITLFMRDDRSIVEGGKVLFYQDKEAESQKKPPQRPALRKIK